MTIILCLIALLFSGNLYAQDFYLDPISGSLDGDGSRSSPWPSLQTVIENNMINSQRWKAPYDWDADDHPLVEKNPDGKIQSGDRLLLMPGYHGDIALIDYVNVSNITVTSAAEEPATLGSILLRSSRGWVFRNLKVDFSYSQIETEKQPVCSNKREPLTNSPLLNGEENTEISRSIGTLVTINSHSWRGPSSNIIITNNTITSADNISKWGAAEWRACAKSGIRLNSTHSEVTNNTIKNINFGITVTSNWNLIRNNRIINFGGDGLRGVASHLIFENNLIANAFDINRNHDDGFQSWVSDKEKGIHDIILRGNKFFNDLDHPGKARGIVSDFQGIGMFDGPYDHILIENNLLYINHWHAITVMGGTFSIIRNNTVADSDPKDKKSPWIKISATKNNEYGRDNAIYNNLGYVKSQSNTEISSNNIYISPNEYDAFFTNIKSHDFSLKNIESAIDAGTHIPGIPALTTDINGNVRTEIPDIGAFEYQPINLHPICRTGQNHIRGHHRCVTTVRLIFQ
jgi:hypothetical protein